MTAHTSETGDRTLPLRERKKLRTRRELADAALTLFTERGFDATTLDELVDAVEVSKRTFFRYFSSKEEVAMAAEAELWDTYVAVFADREIHGPALTTLREALSAAILNLGDDWEQRFMTARWLAARTPALRDHSLLSSITVQRRLVDELEAKLGGDSREDVRLRLLGELALSAWRCGASNWVRANRESWTHGGDHGGRTALVRHVEEAFDALPASLALSTPDGP
ncbi:TetR family transcriptional regulator [Haloactinomyces albus]|uniref:AcrR family transcriptional regulator n=1 Tax=Haloactinomyces albus TaxID=1352928 RepID=A0AAE4CMY3_9ACTN|nr:TetR family transcriptional regulator [Haloactinomyces albus]MDR7301407.1 AcrR family transcriptional regulator [Haloactinomyces albus]